MDVLKLLPDGTKLPAHDPPLEPRDAAVFLLHIAAEVEHALLVQYLYAAYSLVGDEDTLLPGDLPEADLRKLAAGWSRKIKIRPLFKRGYFSSQNIYRPAANFGLIDRRAGFKLN